MQYNLDVAIETIQYFWNYSISDYIICSLFYRWLI
uniref:Uncharacterized protein n=1 Tax=Anguilla anguilla TaxID=7936 RepID=A0A0E9X7U7_ANGAN